MRFHRAIQSTLARWVGASWALLLVATGPTTAASPASQVRTGEIDQRPALVVGDWTVSHYLIDKYYGRYLAEFQQQHHRDPNSGEKRAWFDLYLAKQVIVGHAAALGYLNRPEVQEIVARMQRYMLTQPAGPFYLRLFSHEPIPEEKLKGLYARTLATTDFIVARFSDESVETQWLGANFSQLPMAEQTRRLLQCRDRGEAEVCDGPRSWPFRPFVEIADIIGTVEPGRWIRHLEPRLGIYHILVRKVSSKTHADPAGIPTSFRMAMERVQQELVVRRRRLELLDAAAFSFDSAAAERVLAYWGVISPSGGKLAELPAGSLMTASLFHYRLGAEQIAVNVETYRRYFNELFIRRTPRTLPDLRQSAEDFVVEELDYRAAKAQAIDATPQFAEDRHGFAGTQVLDFFEKEILVPQLGIGPAEIERYYREHATEFRHPVKIRGRLLGFENRESALAWKREADGAHPTTSRPKTDEIVEMTKGQPLPGLDNMKGIFLHSAIGEKSGPFPRGETNVIFIKQADLLADLTPLQSVADSIRETLQRPALAVRELQLATELAGRRQIEDHVDYVRYGLSSTELKLPWR